MLIHAPISLGELVDKITILEIKADNIAQPSQLANVRHELAALTAILGETLDAEQMDELSPSKAELRAVNAELWQIEDDIRECERRGQFDETFVRLARAVYFTNDRRAALKKRINEAFGSELVEEKSYREYGQQSPPAR